MVQVAVTLLILFFALLVPTDRGGSICNHDADGENGDIKTFEPLITECPPPGEFIAVTFQVKFPTKTRLVTTSSIQISFAIAHNGGVDDDGEEGGVVTSFDQIDGIMAGRVFALANCVVPSADPSMAIDMATPNNFYCSDDLNSATKLCSGASTQTTRNQGSVQDFLYLIWNTGGCNGKIKIEVNLDDSPGIGNLRPSECRSGLSVEGTICEGGNASPPTIAPARDTTSSTPDSSGDIIRGISKDRTLPFLLIVSCFLVELREIVAI